LLTAVFFCSGIFLLLAVLRLVVPTQLIRILKLMASLRVTFRPHFSPPNGNSGYPPPFLFFVIDNDPSFTSPLVRKVDSIPCSPPSNHFPPPPPHHDFAFPVHLNVVDTMPPRGSPLAKLPCSPLCVSTPLVPSPLKRYPRLNSVVPALRHLPPVLPPVKTVCKWSAPPRHPVLLFFFPDRPTPPSPFFFWASFWFPFLSPCWTFPPRVVPVDRRDHSCPQ